MPDWRSILNGGSNLLIYGHRGSPATSPENTLISFQEAIDAGVDGLEFDVRASSDSVLVILHDRDLARTTSLSGNVDELPFSTIRTADAGDGQRVPTFEEVLDLVGDRVHLDIEVKQAGLEATILSTLSQYSGVRWALSSFDEDILVKFRELSTTADLIPIVPFASDELLSFASKLSSPAVALMASSYTEPTADLFARAELPVIVWTVNDVAEAERVEQLGARGLCSDCPGKLISARSTNMS
jgi:glycerophosphoryl diester phosphodiesterase